MALYPARLIPRLAFKPIELEVAHQVRLRNEGRYRTAYEQRFARNLMCGIGYGSLLDGKRRTNRCLKLIDYIIESRWSVVAQALNIK